MGFQPRIIGIQSAKGGVGCSIIANNLAISLVYETKKPVCLIELDVIRGGCQAGLLNIAHEVSKQKNVKELLSSEVTKESFTKNLIKHKTGVNLLSADTSEELESLSTLQVISILSTAGSLFENIVVDLAQPFISEEMITTFDFASSVYMVLNPDIVTFEHTQKFLDLMKDLSFPSSKFQVLLNMSGISPTELDLNTIQSYMGRKVLSKIPYSIENFITSVNTGVPLLQSGVNGEINRAFLELAKMTVQIPPTNLEKAIESAMENADKFSSNDQSSNNNGSSHHNQVHVPHEEKRSSSQTLYGLDKETYKEIKSVTHKALISEMRLDKLTHIDLNDPVKKAELKHKIVEKIGTIFDQQGFQIPGRTERSDMIKDIADEALGFGPLEDLLSDPEVTEVMVNGIDKIYVEKKGRLTLSPKTFTDEKQLRVIVDRIVAPIGRRIDESSPYVDARLPDGSRVNIVIPPLAIDGASITIRRFPTKRLSIDDFVKYGTLSQDMADFLACCVSGKMNVFISGGTGSGKTTLLNILSSFIPNDERIVTIEDAAELRLNQDHIVRLESRPANIEGKGAVTIRDLVKNSLRMRPDRVVIGEIRGGEALDMLQAMNTGHDGSLATGHANTPRDAIARIETMVLMAGMDLPIRAIREQIASAINIIVQQSRMRDGSRKITKIVEITGMEGDIISTQDIFTYEVKGYDEDGKVFGTFNTTKIRPKVIDLFEGRGIKIPSVFSPETILAQMTAKQN